MKEKLEDKLLNCSRCGLCMEMCPVYKVKKTETSSLRGKFLQLLGVIKGDIKYTKNVSYNVDLCLGCKKCIQGCPSNLNVIEIFSNVRYKKQTLFEKMFYSLPSFKIKMFVLKILYKFKYPLGRNEFKKLNDKNKNTVHFRGCVSKAVNSGFKFQNEGKFKCCALPFYLKGRIDLYEKYKRKNIELIKKADKVIFDCATCFDTVLNYEELSDKEKEKLIYFTEYYKSKNLKSNKKYKVIFHKPCHLPDNKFEEIKEILKSIENIEFYEFEEEKDCCGFGGDFFTRHFKTASKLSIDKAKKIEQTKADIILTTCPTCLWSLKFGRKVIKGNYKIMDLSEFLSSVDV